MSDYTTKKPGLSFRGILDIIRQMLEEGYHTYTYDERREQGNVKYHYRLNVRVGEIGFPKRLPEGDDVE